MCQLSALYFKGDGLYTGTPVIVLWCRESIGANCCGTVQFVIVQIMVISSRVVLSNISSDTV